MDKPEYKIQGHKRIAQGSYHDWESTLWYDLDLVLKNIDERLTALEKAKEQK